MSIFGSLFNSEPEKYSSEWIRNLSDDEWREERELVRQRHCHGNKNAILILDRFDNELRRRKYDGRPWSPPARSEHGWYLLEDDD